MQRLIALDLNHPTNNDLSPITWDCELEKRNDETMIAVIAALDSHIAQTSRLNLSTAAHILRAAKENLITWTAQTACNETPEQKLINSILYNNDLFPVMRPATQKSKTSHDPLGHHLMKELKNLANFFLPAQPSSQYPETKQ